MYDQQTTSKVKEIASIGMDAAQQKINELDSIGNAARHQAGGYLLNRQSWLGNVSFTLAAIGSAVLVGKDTPQPFVMASLLLFLVTGLWVAIYQKRQFERAVAHASKEVDQYRPLIYPGDRAED